MPSVAIVVLVPSVKVSRSCAEYHGSVPYFWLPAMPTLPEYQPLPTIAPSTFSPGRIWPVTSETRYCRRFA